VLDASRVDKNLFFAFYRIKLGISRKRLSLLLLAILVLAIAQGCNGKPPIDPVGKWAEVDGPDTVEFTSGGTFTGNFVFDSQGFQKPVNGSYTVSGNKVTLTATPDAKDSMVWTISNENGAMGVTYKQGGAPKLDGSSAKFHRAS
jgi:hypothetical protein